MYYTLKYLGIFKDFEKMSLLFIFINNEICNNNLNFINILFYLIK